LKKKIEIIIPCFNEEGNIGIIAEKLAQIASRKHEFKVVFIDDGSTDKTLIEIKKLQIRNLKIGYLSFSRNFGHQAALKAGLDQSDADCVICMDADLQQPPDLIPEMIKKW